MHTLLSKFVHLSKDGRSHHIFNLDFACPFWVKEEEKFTYTRNDIERVKGFRELLKLGKGWHQFKYIIFQVLFFQVAEAIRVVQRNLNSCLKQIHLSDDIVEERHDFDAAKLVTFKFKEGAGGEKLAAFWGQLGGDKHKLIVVDSLCAIVWLGKMVF
jgi:hypothetical protein